MVDFKRAVVRELRWRRDGRAARPGDRRRPRDRGRLACRRHGAHRGGGGDRVRGPAGRARQPRAAGLGRRAGEAPRGVRGQAARLLPPGRAERRGPGAARRRGRAPRAARPTSRCSSSRSRSGWTAASCRARTAGVSSSRRRARLTALGADILKAEFPYDAAVTDETRWAEACAELDAATPMPWVLLSGGVDDATFERQVAVACRAGASGVLVGRSVWAEAATHAGVRRATPSSPAPGGDRLARLTALVDDLAVAVAAALDGGPGAGAARSRLVRSGTEPTTAVRDLDLLVVGELNADIVVTDPDPVPVFGQAERLVEGRPPHHRQLVGDHRLRRGPARACGSRWSASWATTRSAGSCSRRSPPRGVDTTGCRVAPGRPDGRLGHPRQRHRSRDPDRAGHDRGHARDRRARPRCSLAHGTCTWAAYFLQPGLAADVPALFRAAHAGGATTSLDPNWDPSGAWDGGFAAARGRGRRAAAECRARPCARRGTDDVEAAARALAGDVAAGDRGREAAAPTGRSPSNADGRSPVGRSTAVDAVDTTGAGDAFDAGFLAARLEGRPVADALGYGGRLRLAVDPGAGRHGRPADRGRGRGLAAGGWTCTLSDPIRRVVGVSLNAADRQDRVRDRAS